MARFELGFWNGWLFSLPFLVLVASFVGMRRDLIKRMSDMSGYTAKEKCFTVLASLAPYPFLVASMWLPLTSVLPLCYLGLIVYLIGMGFCAASLKVIVASRPDQMFASGPYRVSRHPMYVSATMVFLGICLSTCSVFLAAYLVVALSLQHAMILAEERVCREKYGSAYERYRQQVPRYLLIT